jgi:RHS repeat-associated protein
VERKVTRGIDPPEVEGYQWDGWKLIMIAKLNTDGTYHSRKWSCVWRPDIGSSLYARSDWMRAGGVGGLAWLQTGAVQNYSYRTGSGEVHVPLADHMGNVRHYYQFKASGKTVTGQLVASYEYDAFGREVRAWGTNTPVTSQPPGLPANRPWADLLPFHYSSKLRDADSGFNYYGYRFYDPGAGRWLNRDPIGEEGGLNLYGMVGNDGVNDFDIDGLSPRSGRPPRGGPVANAQTLEAANIGRDIARSHIRQVMDSLKAVADKCCSSPAQRDRILLEMERIIGPTVGPPSTASAVRQHPANMWRDFDIALSRLNRLSGPCRPVAEAANAVATTNARPPNLTPRGAGRDGALNEALRRNGVPTSQSPSMVGPNVGNDGKEIPGRTYIWIIRDSSAPGGWRAVRIRDDAAGDFHGPGNYHNRGPHFNDDLGNHYDY